jgi:hypothetical protein
VTACARVVCLVKYTTYAPDRPRRRAMRRAAYAVLFVVSLVVTPIAVGFYAHALGVNNLLVDVLGGVVITAALSAALWRSR